MTLAEKAAYLKGLMDGIKLDTEKDENRLLKAVVDLLQDMAVSIDDLEDNAIAVSDELDEIEEDDLTQLKTVGDCVRYLSSKLN